jgi:hypothetical protein
MAYDSSPELLVLHAVRIQGMTDKGGIARRFALDPDQVEELLLDDEARGWVQRVAFAGVNGWSLTGAGRVQGGRMLAEELRVTDARAAVEAVYGSFLELNGRLLNLLTKWQIRPEPWDSMAPNDHSALPWDQDVLKSLAYLSRNLRPIGDRLANALSRFAFYPDRFSTALDRVDRGERKWVDEPKIDSCHTVWFELHEDFLATLGLERGDSGVRP